MDSLGDRMKRYENSHRLYLPPRQPVIIRVDGKAFHTFTRGCEKPFDNRIEHAMYSAAYGLLREVQNARFAYVQSDEISLLLIDYNTFSSQQWFDGNLQKMVSVAASVASVQFTIKWEELVGGPPRTIKPAYFDGRAFVLSEREVTNYFVWRQQDATRNAVQMVARAHFSHKQCHGKSCFGLQQMLYEEKGIDFEKDTPTCWKRGRIVLPDGTVDDEIPLFTQDREYIEKFLEIEEE